MSGSTAARRLETGTRKVWARGARHCHASKDTSFVDLQDYRASDRDDCLWYDDCRDVAATRNDRSVCASGCNRYLRRKVS
jgi:hypothetical protein